MCAALAAPTGTALAAQSVADQISQMLEQGHLGQAASAAQAHLRDHPQDVQVRFLQGVIATEQGDDRRAIELFTALTREYPTLPEPYNNLAVLYAAQGEHDKAVQTLEAAIRTSPSYATAHANLGDLYAQMASEAYSRALQLDSSRQDLAPKLSLIREIVPVGTAAAQPAAPTVVAQADTGAAAARAAQEQAALAAQEQAAREEAVREQAAQQEAARQAQALAAQQQAEREQAEREQAERQRAQAAQQAARERAAQEQAAADAEAKARAERARAEMRRTEAAAAAAAAQTPDTAAPDQAIQAQVEAAVRNWARAWAAQDIDAYLAAYSPNFQPADGSSLAAWREQRHARIVGRAPITVELSNLRVDVEGDKATARFRQLYSSGSFRATTRKTLQLVLEQDQWRIVSERTGS
ncbi:hypothetical protein AAV94_03400 [Lampropedia cohaerens]|uniref:Cds6 C-terminal domain-containing protein n=1 Tax=Lampropedia cohaerens TaxID=1610491 RepID=A0A0U1Q2G0_9BURK|nr:hypothetical protein AAV94_03400 [Lampropedia cohaerens]